MSETYRYTDEDDSELRVESSIKHSETAFIVSEEGVFVPAADLPKVVAELYRAAGQEPPRTLPHLEWYGNDRTAFSFNGVHFTRDYKTISGLGGNWNSTTARGVAAVLADMADAADAELDPAALGPLTALIDDVSDLSTEAIAAAILRAGYVKTGGGS